MLVSFFLAVYVRRAHDWFVFLFISAYIIAAVLWASFEATSASIITLNALTVCSWGLYQRIIKDSHTSKVCHVILSIMAIYLTLLSFEWILYEQLSIYSDFFDSAYSPFIDACMTSLVAIRLIQISRRYKQGKSCENRVNHKNSHHERGIFTV